MPSSAIWPPSQVLSEGDRSFFVHSSLSHVRPNIWLTSLLLSKIFSQTQNIFKDIWDISCNQFCFVHSYLFGVQSKLIIFLFFPKIEKKILLFLFQICFVWIIIIAKYLLLSPLDLGIFYCLVIFSPLSCQKQTWFFPSITFIGRYHMRNLILVSG